MKKTLQLNRRHFFKTGLGVAGTFAASHALASICSPVTGGQDLGPFFPDPGTPIDPVRENPDTGLPLHLANDNDLTFVKGRQGHALGQVVIVQGQVTDKECRPIEGASITIWQASQSGRYNHKGDAANPDFRDPRTGAVIQRKHDPNFQYWGHALSDSSGYYSFKTIVPGFYPANLSTGWYRPPHIHFLVAATGFPELVTQMYFRGEEIEDNAWIQELNRRDFLLQTDRISQAQREDLVVDFRRTSPTSDLAGEFNLTLN